MSPTKGFSFPKKYYSKEFFAFLVSQNNLQQHKSTDDAKGPREPAL